jgi:hypothetical protein
MGDIFLNAEEIGHVVDQRKKEGKNQQPGLEPDSGRDKGQDEKGSQDHLEPGGQGHIFPEKKAKGRSQKAGEDNKKRTGPRVLFHGPYTNPIPGLNQCGRSPENT